jgi:hypothetical protein
MFLQKVCGVHFGYRPISSRALEIRKNTLPVRQTFTAALNVYFDACAKAADQSYNAVMVFLKKSDQPNPDYTIRAVKGGFFPSDFARAFEEKGYETVVTLNPASGRSFKEEFPDWPMSEVLHPAYYKSRPHLRVPITIDADCVSVRATAPHIRLITGGPS